MSLGGIHSTSLRSEKIGCLLRPPHLPALAHSHLPSSFLRQICLMTNDLLASGKGICLMVANNFSFTLGSFC